MAMPATPPPPPLLWDVFCRVIDNHGDLGVCWRLARALAGRGQAVRLWVDDPSALAWMAPGVVLAAAAEPAPPPGAIAVLRWPADTAPAPQPGPVVVEAFGCDPPAAFVAAMAAAAGRGAAPVWINLEYLSAEPYVERSHGLRSPVFSGPGAGLEKWFFYPGFTERTGGLLQGDGAEIRGAPGDATAQPVTDPHRPRRLLVFGYPAPHWRATVAALQRWAAGDGEWQALLPPGGLRRQWQALGVPAAPPADRSPTIGGRVATRPLGLSWRPIEPVPQPDFDTLLAGCDLAIVRGEDSFVRAQLVSDAPFLWQIYPQDDGAHEAKLQAFLALYLADAPLALAAPVAKLFRAVNGLQPWPDPATAGAWPDRAAWRDHQRTWRRRCLAASSLDQRLMDFVARQRPRAECPALGATPRRAEPPATG